MFVLVFFCTGPATTDISTYCHPLSLHNALPISKVESFGPLAGARHESVVTITGTCAARSAETVNAKLPTGGIEIRVEQVSVVSLADPLPLQVNSEEDYGEEIRLRYRFLDLRREKMQRNIALDRKSTRLNSSTNAHIVCRLLLEK